MTTVALYTPIYYASPGTQYRVDLIRKSLEKSGYRTTLISGSGAELKNLYNILGERLLSSESVWKIMGRSISGLICKHRPRNVILFIDISASAIPYLKKHDINVILSIEDLTPEYKKYSLKASRKFYQIFLKYADQADVIISSSYTLSKRLEHMGLKAIPVLIGLEPYVSLEEALARQYPPVLLHAGQLDTQKKIKIIIDLAHKYKILVHNFGNLANKLNHSNIKKYRESDWNKVLEIVRKAHIGIVLEYRKPYSLTRLYFHVSLLQPIIADGCGPWIDEASNLGITLYPLNTIEEIMGNYNRYVKRYAEVQKKLTVPNVHEPLLNLIR
ncbi:MAG: hypothetical protein QXJ14_04360 [Candidatus Aenigmatarchaeota archaeon]